jgi:hypothetical protein
MSTIEEMFEKDINRPINPVIKVSDQGDESVIFQELDEYVVTQEIDENLEKFYRDLIEGMKKGTDSTGVWISGDFGSGKSHFLKILSFLLKNSDISGKKAIEYLQKKVSSSVYPYMQAIGRKDVETVLFDIDAESKEGQNADYLVQVYLMVFNRMLGLSTNASVANIERHIIEEGKYDLFKSEFEKIANKTWESVRASPTLNKPKIRQALVATGLYNEVDAETVAKKATEKFEISATEFASLVKEHCDTKGDDYVLFFLVDEVGQFISGNTQLMLKLQTITEELGVKCRGKVWNVVTSQEDIDSIVTDLNNKDYSKIQGRFSIRVKMSSSDVKEVIEKRILFKKKDNVDELQAYYESNREAIHNKLGFDNDVNIRLYKTKEEYSNTYPFVPYQYEMLQTMLTQLRNKSRAGKNISNAARSMLKTFKDTVVLYKDKNSDIVIPMYVFYDSLTSELDSPTLQLFYNASKNDLLNEFDINVLKTLFLVKYYDGLTTSIMNITSMMVSSFDENRITLKKDVENALERLASQNLIQRNGDTYTFLTNEEQEVNLEIKRETVDVGKRVQEIARVAFGEILNVNGKYKYDSTHTYSFNRIVDGENVDNTSYELTLAILTPRRKVDSSTLMLESTNGVILELPADERVIFQCNEYISTESYIRKNMSSDLPKRKREILEAKESELKEMKSRFKSLLSDALQYAGIYVNGSMVSDINDTNPESRFSKAADKLIVAVYSKMDYIRNPKNKNMIDQMFKNRSITTFDESCGSEKFAVDAMLEYMSMQAQMNATVRISNIMERFRKRPYGFTDYDIQWVLALLFRHNKVELIYEGVHYDGKTVDPNTGIDLITRFKNYDRVEVRLRESVSSASIAKAADIFKILLSKSMQFDEGALVTAINEGSKEIIREIDGYMRQIESNPRYPWKNEFEQMRAVLNNTASMGSPKLFSYIDQNESELRGLRSELDDRRSFYGPDSPMKRLFDKGLDALAAYEKDRYYASAELTEIKKSIEAALSSDRLKDLPKLNDLCVSFDEARQAILDRNRAEEAEKLDAIKESYVKQLSPHPGLFKEMGDAYDNAKSNIDSVSSISELSLISRGFDSIVKGITRRIPKPREEQQQGDKEEDRPEEPPKPIGSIYAYGLFSELDVDNEEDIDRIVEEIRTKLKGKLKDGPFEIKW